MGIISNSHILPRPPLSRRISAETGTGGRTRVRDVGLQSGRTDAHDKAGQVLVPEDDLPVGDGMPVDGPLGEGEPVRAVHGGVLPKYALTRARCWRGAPHGSGAEFGADLGRGILHRILLEMGVARGGAYLAVAEQVADQQALARRESAGRKCGPQIVKRNSRTCVRAPFAA